MPTQHTKFKSFTSVAIALAFVGAIPFTIANAAASTPITLKLGDKNVMVSALQTLLIRKGYLNVSAPTGYFGARTKVAVMAFQQAYNLPVTGVMTIPANGAPALFASAAAATSFTPTSLGSVGSEVNTVQKYLIATKFLGVAAPTGYFGAKTKAAVISFQKFHNLPMTGMVDQATFSALSGN